MLAALILLSGSTPTLAPAQSPTDLADALRMATAWEALEKRTAKPARDREGLIRELRAQAQGARASGGAAAPAPKLLGIQAGPPLSSAGKVARWVEITISTSTTLDEKFLLFQPTPKPSAPAPLIVFFHGYSVGPLDVVFNTTFLEEAQTRGWFLVAPMGAVDKHFSHPISQINTQEALTWVIQHCAIDTQRIYGVGFSMGGGAVTNYAARHVDVQMPMLAAVVDHTGSVSLRFNLAWDTPGHQALFDLLFGNGMPNSAEPWKMNRCSVIDMHPLTLQVDQDQDLARNLSHVPMQIARADVDPFWFLSTECNALDSHMVNDLGKMPGPDYQYIISPGTSHDWSSLDETATCDWLSNFTLQVPQSGKTLVDTAGNYFHFFVGPLLEKVFTPFTWNILPTQNEVQIAETSNLWHLRVYTQQAGLDPLQPLRVVAGPNLDATGDILVLADYPGAPTAVLRDGQPMSSPIEWMHVPPHVILFEPDFAQHTWEVLP